MQLTGIIIAVLGIQNGTSQSGKPWAKQEFVLETEERYPKRCCFQMFGEDKIKAAALVQNMRVTVDFDIDAREYQGRWYNDVQAWRVTRLDATTAAQAAPTAQVQPQPQPQAYQPPQPQQAQYGASPVPPMPQAAQPQPTATGDDLPF